MADEQQNMAPMFVFQPNITMRRDTQNEGLRNLTVNIRNNVHIHFPTALTTNRNNRTGQEDEATSDSNRNESDTDSTSDHSSQASTTYTTPAVVEVKQEPLTISQEKSSK